MLRLNPTRLRRFFRCEYEWHCYVMLSIDLRQAPASPHRDRGKAFHALLEHALRVYAATGDVYAFVDAEGREAAHAIFVQLWETEGCDIDEQTAEELLDAIRWHVPRLGLDQWEVLALDDGTSLIEADLRAPLIDGVELQAIVDLVFRHRVTGEVWFVDWKTTYKPIDTLSLRPWHEHDYQLAIGREVLKAAGIEVDFAALVSLRSLAPQPPALTAKTRKVSVNKAQLACDWPTFRAALERNGEDPSSESALAVRDYLETSVFDRWRIDVTNERSHAQLMTDMRDAAERMRDLANGAAQPRRTLMNTRKRHGCDECTYRQWCEAGLRGGQEATSKLLGIYYTPREDSPLAGQENYATAVQGPADVYVAFARQHGRQLGANEEFRP